MPNYIIYGGKKITLEEYLQILGPEPGIAGVKLADKKPGDVVKIGKFEMIVLNQLDGGCHLLLKDLYKEPVIFGRNNNFRGSNIERVCQEFAEELKSVVGKENILTQMIVLKNDKGEARYAMFCKAAPLTKSRYEQYRTIIEKFKVDRWWWLATSYKDGDCCVLCVTPGGYINYYSCNYGDCGVRPFCILKSNIFVS